MCKKQNTFNKMNPEMQRASISPSGWSFVHTPSRPQLQGPHFSNLNLVMTGYFHH